MCLLKKHKLPYITIFPKTVYKILEPIDGVNTFKTPYMRFTVKLGETYKGIFRYNNIFKIIKLRFINDGFIHSYDNILDAELNNAGLYNIIKCIIPPFTLYYKGFNHDIASRKLKYIEICVN